ncbi:MAG: hypothetical protein IPL71_24760 [Anaerolineales bacterium]|uniref:hypothetical protein n=1 Tax=Candidatus Villigracilis proximus TaxID=3140683 RepID=UPI003136BD03|nr:hypothetical protein [Anaerolineales bacterium]
MSSRFSPYWNDKLIDLLILIPAVGAAVAGTLLTYQFEKGEIPYRIWQAFTVGLWFWVAGEISGAIYDMLYWDTSYPEFSLVDLFWMLGYFFLGLSLYYQLTLVYGVKSRNRRIYLGLVTLALLITAGLTTLAEKAGLGEGSVWIILFITVLYPVFDLTEGAIAIWLSFLFGRGQWSRPWWGLILFALADSVNTFDWLGGYDLISVSAQDTLNFLALIAYPLSYMVAGLALLSNYYILRYGENSGLLRRARRSEINKPE